MNYSLNIVWSAEDEGFIATVPELKNLSAFGSTYEEAIKEARDAIDVYIETLKDEKLEVPVPTTLANFSGQTRLRMPRQLHQILSVEAERQGVSLNMLMVTLLSLNYGLIAKESKSKGVCLVYVNNDKTENYNLTLLNIEEPKFLGLGGGRLNKECFNIGVDDDN